MARLIGLLPLALALRLVVPGAAAASEDTGPLARWESQIAEASARFGVPAEWIRRVMRAESGGRTHLGGRPIVSPAGAIGLMQLMPETWAQMRSRYRLGDDPRDPRDNILAGTAYLRLMYDRFGYPGLFAAYNAGPARYASHLAGRRPLPRETVAYLAAVAGTPPGTGAIPTPPSLFAIRYEEADRSPRRAAAAAGPDESDGLRASVSADAGHRPDDGRSLLFVVRSAPRR